jgi:hypothetical protein
MKAARLKPASASAAVCEDRDVVDSLKVMVAREDTITPVGQYGEISAVQVSEESRERGGTLRDRAS